MDTKYPTLKRPKRKLCYLTSKESSSKQWEGTLTLGDVEKIFDDFDPSSHGDDDDDFIERRPKIQMGPERDVLHPATRTPGPKQDIDMDLPFITHGPVKTSSPIEENMVVKELGNEKDLAVSPLLFACEDEGREEAKSPLLIQEPQCNGHITEECEEFASPPTEVILSKPKMSSQKKKAEKSCKESHPVKDKTPKEPQTLVFEGKRKSPTQENADPPVSAVRQEPGLSVREEKSETVQRQQSVRSTTRVGKDMTSFLKQLRDAVQPKPACSRKTPVKAPTPPEPEDDFLIMEDDEPCLFSIPSKTATSKKQGWSRTSGNDKDTSTDQGMKDSPVKNAQKRQESEQTKSKLGNQTLDQKTNKIKGKKKTTKKNEVTEPGNDKEDLSCPEDLPAGDLMEEEKINKKKLLKKVPSKESDKEEEQPKARRERHQEKKTLNVERITQEFSDVKKSLKDGNQNSMISSATLLKKRTKKVPQGSDAIKKTMTRKEQSQSSKEQAEAEDSGSLSAQTEKDFADGKLKRNKQPILPEGSSSDEAQIVWKGKRKQPGHRLLDHQITEKTKVTDKQPTLKKAKQSIQEPSVAVLSPVKGKSGRALKKRNPTQPAPSSSQNTNKAKEKKIEHKKNRKTRGDKLLHTTESEPEQQDLDLDLNAQSSPLNLTTRDHTSGEQVFQKVYHHVCKEKRSITPVPVPPRGPGEQLRAAEPEKRRRKPPGNWWMVDDLSQEAISPQPKQQEPIPRKERKKRSKQSRSTQLGTPRNGNIEGSSKPLGGSPVPLLKPQQLSAPKTVKRSLPMYKDLFTSSTETPTVVSSREVGQKNKCKVTARPAKEVRATDCLSCSQTNKHVLCVDAGESRSTQNSPPNNEGPQDSECQSEGRFKALRSGVSSMIQLAQYEDDDDLILPPHRAHAALSVSDLCAPPLEPMVLQKQDKTNLTEWFKNLWLIPDDRSPDITPDHFDWYSYQGRAMGVLVDLNYGFFCSGTILLGSYMKKPLCVDHNSTIAFNLLSSAVIVTINGRDSTFYPGPSFMVPCGHAYSIQNIGSQPAILHYTRIVTESSD